MIYDGTQSGLLTATAKEISDGFIDRSALVERLSRELSREIRTFLNYQAEMKRRRLIGPDMLFEALAFVAMVETGMDRKLRAITDQQDGQTHEPPNIDSN